MSTPKLNLMSVLHDLTKKYVVSVIKASTQRVWVFGHSCDSKNDVRKAYIANLKSIGEVAKQLSDDEAADYCKSAVGSQKAELEALLDDIK